MSGLTPEEVRNINYVSYLLDDRLDTRLHEFG